MHYAPGTGVFLVSANDRIHFPFAEGLGGRGADEIKAEGRVQGMRDMVLHLLTQRFGTPSEKARRSISAITSSQELTRLAERLAQVDSAEELGLA